MTLTHTDATGRASMVDVGSKPISRRRAVAVGLVHMSRDAVEQVRAARLAKGDVLAAAEFAGVMAAKQAAALIPLCHTLLLDKVSVVAEIDAEQSAINVTATVDATARTGVEMEALTAVSVACLTVYDMVKAVDRSMQIGGIRLLEKTGGARGDYRADDYPMSNDGAAR